MTEKTSISLRDRYAGTLLGLACGDALGGPLEFLHRHEIAARFPTTAPSCAAPQSRCVFAEILTASFVLRWIVRG